MADRAIVIATQVGVAARERDVKINGMDKMAMYFALSERFKSPRQITQLVRPAVERIHDGDSVLHYNDLFVRKDVRSFDFWTQNADAVDALRETHVELVWPRNATFAKLASAAFDRIQQIGNKNPTFTKVISMAYERDAGTEGMATPYLMKLGFKEAGTDSFKLASRLLARSPAFCASEAMRTSFLKVARNMRNPRTAARYRILDARFLRKVGVVVNPPDPPGKKIADLFAETD